MQASFISPEEFEAHARGLFPGKRLFLASEAAQIAGVTVKTIANASSAKTLLGVGTKRNRRYQLWEIYKWECVRRMPKAPKLAQLARGFQRRPQRQGIATTN